MSGPLILGKTNRVTSGQEFFSLPILAARILALEQLDKDKSVQLGEQDKELDVLVKALADLTKKLEQHIKLGHSNNRVQEKK